MANDDLVQARLAHEAKNIPTYGLVYRTNTVEATAQVVEAASITGCFYTILSDPESPTVTAIVISGSASQLNAVAQRLENRTSGH